MAGSLRCVEGAMESVWLSNKRFSVASDILSTWRPPAFSPETESTGCTLACKESREAALS